MSKTPFNAHTDPPGCIYRATDRDIFFNSREKGGEVVFSSERKPVCKGKVDSVGASGKLLKPVAAWDQAWSAQGLSETERCQWHSSST